MGAFWFLVREVKVWHRTPLMNDALMRSITSKRDGWMDGGGVADGTVRFSGPPSAIRFKALLSLRDWASLF